jgi:hypothetical protein
MNKKNSTAGFSLQKEVKIGSSDTGANSIFDRGWKCELRNSGPNRLTKSHPPRIWWNGSETPVDGKYNLA